MGTDWGTTVRGGPVIKSPQTDPQDSSPKPRRARIDGAVYFEHATETECGDDRYHRSCTGRWRGEVLISSRAGKRVSARTKTEMYERLSELRDELGQGIRSSATYTVENAVTDWLGSLVDKSAKIVSTNREILAPLLDEIGRKAILRDLQADDVIKALTAIAETRSSRTVRDTRAAMGFRYHTAGRICGKNGIPHNNTPGVDVAAVPR